MVAVNYEEILHRLSLIFCATFGNKTLTELGQVTELCCHKFKWSPLRGPQLKWSSPGAQPRGGGALGTGHRQVRRRPRAPMYRSDADFASAFRACWYF